MDLNLLSDSGTGTALIKILNDNLPLPLGGGQIGTFSLKIYFIFHTRLIYLRAVKGLTI